MSRRSVAWDHFDLKSELVNCKHCDAVFKYNTATTQMMYLCIPATSVPSEWVFSAAGLTVTMVAVASDTRSCQHAYTVFLNKNPQTRAEVVCQLLKLVIFHEALSSIICYVSVIVRKANIWPFLLAWIVLSYILTKSVRSKYYNVFFMLLFNMILLSLLLFWNK